MSEQWSNNPNAPQIPPFLYPVEKLLFAGYLVASIFHGMPIHKFIYPHPLHLLGPGIVIALFVRCMIALFNPTNRAKGGTKWGLLAHTLALFLTSTVAVATGLYILPLSYINAREFPGGNGVPPGPYGYQWLPKFLAITIISDSAVQVNQWLVDGLLVSSVLNSAT